MARSFRHRITLLVSLAAAALMAVTAVTLVLGRRNEEQLSGVETRYVPLLELDRDLKATFIQIPRTLEDASSAADASKLEEADALEAELVRRLAGGASMIAGNGGQPQALIGELRRYYSDARAISAELLSGTSAGQLHLRIEAMARARRALFSHLDVAASPDRRDLAAAFATARALQRTSLWVDVSVAIVVLGLMAVLSLRIIRRMVTSLHAVGAGVERLSHGDFDHEIDAGSDDEFGALAREANRTAGRLREYRAQREREDWIKTGLGGLTDHIAGDLDPATLGAKAMVFLAGYVGASAAAAYAAGEDGTLHRLATHGVDSADALPDNFRLGPGALDAAIASPEIRVERGSSGLVIVVPLLHDERSLGIIELAMPAAPDDRTLELSSRLRGVVGVAFRVAEAHQQARALLVATQQQAAATELANKELEAFSYSVSHDLRAPLRGIDGFSQMLLEDCAELLPATSRGYLQRIRLAAQRMAELIDALLELARVSRAELHRERIDLSALFATIVGELQRDDVERRVEIHVQSHVTATADPRLIRITLENLIGNAWKFTSKTAAAVIEFGVRDDGGHRVYYVRDNGAGFDMAYVARLFGAFQRLHTDAEFPGTGIGLATVQRIIERHGGQIWVDAEVAHGANFQFTLPEVAVSPPPDALIDALTVALGHRADAH